MSEIDLSTDNESESMTVVRTQKPVKRRSVELNNVEHSPTKKHASQKREQMPLIKAFNIDVKTVT